jgi:hypothetical protein
MTEQIFAAILSSLTIVTVTVSAPTNARALIVNSQSATLVSATDRTDPIDTNKETPAPVADEVMDLSGFRQPLETVLFVAIVSCAWNAHNRKKQLLSPAKNLVNREYSYPNAVNPEIYDRLVMLLRGDLQCIERLLNSVRLKHPERSEQWYWEKILYDLERDRRRS